jgi:hypothetical protein
MRRQVRKIRIERIKTLRRLPLVAIVVATTTVAIGAAVVSRQVVKVNESKVPERSSTVTNSANQNYLTVKLAGLRVQTNQKGQIRPLTQQEAQNMADGIKEMINQSPEGLKSVRHPDGSVSVDLQDRFQNVTVARKNDDGTVTQSCVDNSQSAAAFFELDPQLFQGRTKTGPTAESTSASTKQANRSRQVRNEDH